jgi:DNA-binding transcriptional ArsR family regulator
MAALDRTFSALAHPVRREVLARLRKGEAPVKDLARALKVTGPALTRHLHMLEQAGLITRSRDAQRRPCRLSVAPLRELNEWMESYRQFWTDSFDRLDEHLKKIQKAKKKGKRDGKRV